MTEAERNALIEECAVAAEAQDRAGYEWVHNSLWAKILLRAGNNVRLLKTRPIVPRDQQLQALRQAIIDHTYGDGFWIGEILLNELEKETGYNGAVGSSVPGEK